jgi:galactosylceramidase
MLVDYPEQQQLEILDYLFKPSFGASLHMLKVEIGGDMLSTDGSESSHMHSKDQLDLTAGYEWWLMTEAKKRNPDITLYGLPWAFPAWVGNDPVTGAPNASGTPFTHPQQTADYMLAWVKGAKTEYNLDIDWLGIWNESPTDATYVKTLRKTLDDAGFSHTRLVGHDSGGQANCVAMETDPAYKAAVDVIGLHYPSDFSPLPACDALGKPIWASEESSSFDDLNGAACWARVVHSHFVRTNISSSIMWNLLGSYAPGTSWFASSLMQAIEPWSGHYSGGGNDAFPVVWAMAHVTQFAKIGWRYLQVGSGTVRVVRQDFALEDAVWIPRMVA